MSEFVKVMEIAKRVHRHMRKGTECSCEKCLLLAHRQDDQFFCSLAPDVIATGKVDFEYIESRLLAWDKEHPESGYPTWSGFVKVNFPDASDTNLCPKHFMSHSDSRCEEFVSCEDCTARSIPAEIAEKLGIRPIMRDGDSEC